MRHRIALLASLGSRTTCNRWPLLCSKRDSRGTFVLGRLLEQDFARSYSRTTRQRAPVTFVKPSSTVYESIDACPEPTCECAATPPLPEPIDRRASMRESAPGYLHHIVISTGRTDWSRRIEDEGKIEGETRGPPPPTTKDRFKSIVKRFFRRQSIERSRQLPREHASPVGLARGLKTELGRKGTYFDPMRPMLITNSSFVPSFKSGPDAPAKVSALLFPTFISVSNIPDTVSGHEEFIRKFLLPGARLDARTGHEFFQVRPITHPVILICSHGTRDARCGILGPILGDEFRHQLQQAGFTLDDRFSEDSKAPMASVGLVSHIGGHKWAGNVIVYIPPDSSTASTDTSKNRIAGKGIWYGRVEPYHVEGIVQETVLRGRVINELLRGVRG